MQGYTAIEISFMTQIYLRGHIVVVFVLEFFGQKRHLILDSKKNHFAPFYLYFVLHRHRTAPQIAI